MVGHTGRARRRDPRRRGGRRGRRRRSSTRRARRAARVLITADHGNCELMKDPATGQPHTAHTTQPRPAPLRERRRPRRDAPRRRPHLRRRADDARAPRAPAARRDDRAARSSSQLTIGAVAELPTIEGFRVLEELGSGSLSTVYKAVEEPLGRVGRPQGRSRARSRRRRRSPRSSSARRGPRRALPPEHRAAPRLREDATRGCVLVLEFVDGFSLVDAPAKKPAVRRPTSWPPSAPRSRAASPTRTSAASSTATSSRRTSSSADARRGEALRLRDRAARACRARRAARRSRRCASRTSPRSGRRRTCRPSRSSARRVDARSDVFSLGVVLYQLVCGARALRARRRGRPARPPRTASGATRPSRCTDARPTCRAPLERIVMRAIEKLPADRFQTAEALAEQLEELVDVAVRAPTADKLVVHALEDAGLVSAPEARWHGGRRRESKRASVRRAVAGPRACSAPSRVAGGIALQATAHREGTTARRAAARARARRRRGTCASSPRRGPRCGSTASASTSRPSPAASRCRQARTTSRWCTRARPSRSARSTIVSGETRTIDVVMAVPGPRAPKGDPGADPRQRREGQRR